MARHGPDPIDVLVGNNVRIYRAQRKLSQTALAERLGVTFQQVQKYEKGTNRIGAGRLYRISMILGLPIAAFFEGAPKINLQEKIEPHTAMLASPDAIRMLKAYNAIQGVKVKRLLAGLAEDLSAQE